MCYKKVICKHCLSYHLKYVSNGIPLFHCQLSWVLKNKGGWRKYFVNNSVSIESAINSINSSASNLSPPALLACNKNASLSPYLSRCPLQHVETSISIYCTIMSITTLPQRKHIRWGRGRTVNSTVTVMVCTRCWEGYWNYFAAWRDSSVMVVLAWTPQPFKDIKLFLWCFWNIHVEPFICGTALLSSEIEDYEKNMNLLWKNTKFLFVVNLCLLQWRGILGNKAYIVPQIK